MFYELLLKVKFIWCERFVLFSLFIHNRTGRTIQMFPAQMTRSECVNDLTLVPESRRRLAAVTQLPACYLEAATAKMKQTYFLQIAVIDWLNAMTSNEGFLFTEWSSFARTHVGMAVTHRCSGLVLCVWHLCCSSSWRKTKRSVRDIFTPPSSHVWCKIHYY